MDHLNTTDDAPADETDVADADRGTETDGSEDGGDSQSPAAAEFTGLDIQTAGDSDGEVTVQQAETSEEMTKRLNLDVRGERLRQAARRRSGSPPHE